MPFHLYQTTDASAEQPVGCREMGGVSSDFKDGGMFHLELQLVSLSVFKIKHRLP